MYYIKLITISYYILIKLLIKLYYINLFKNLFLLR